MKQSLGKKHFIANEEVAYKSVILWIKKRREI
jgi:head-tail adaptor